MAQLTDTLVSGDERVTGMIYGTQAGNYATCSEAGATKTASIPGFVLTVGVHVWIKFSANNTAATPTLNVSGTGAKSIKVKGNNLATAGDLAANGVYEFVYDGTNWELTGAAPTSHASSATTYGIGTTANYGHVKINDNSAPLEIGSTHTDGVATGNAHYHNGIGSVARTSVTTPDITHINTDTKAHMVLSQITASSGTTHDPGDGYVLTFMWDTATPWDTQLYIPDAISSAADYGRLKFRTRGRESPNTVEWGDWQYLPAAATGTLLTSSDNINNCKGNNIGDIIAYYWKSTSMPTGTLPFSDSSWGAVLVVYKTADNYCTQLCYRSSKGIYQRSLVSGTWGSWAKVLVSSDIATGSANGTISVAGTDVAVKGLGGAAYMGTGTSGSTVALGNHTHSQYLEKAGGTMTGGITLPTNFYHQDGKFGIDAKNSDIINANSIYFNDVSTDTDEGIHFKRGDSGNTDNYDSVWIDNGKICFVPNHAVSAHTPSSSAQIVPRLPASVSDNQVVLTNGTTGALKTSAASSLSVGTAAKATGDADGTNIKQNYMKATSGTKSLAFGSSTKIGTVNGSDVNVSLPSLPTISSRLQNFAGFKVTKPLSASWYDGYGASLLTFYGGSGHIYHIGFRLQGGSGATASSPFLAGSRIYITVDGVPDAYVQTLQVYWKADSENVEVMVLTPLKSSSGNQRINLLGVITRDYGLTTSNSTIITTLTPSIEGWTEKTTDVVFTRMQPLLPNNGESGVNLKYNINISGTAAAADTAGEAGYATALKVNSAIGSSIKPVYIGANGIPQAIPDDSTYSNYLTLNVINARTASEASTANKWKTGRSFTIKDDGLTHAGTSTTGVDGSGDVVLRLPTEITLTKVNATTFNGTATSANKAGALNLADAVGSSTRPVYFNAQGAPVAISYKSSEEVDGVNCLNLTVSRAYSARYVNGYSFVVGAYAGATNTIYLD